jgi:type IV pilus assembly protein PilC
LAVIWKTIHISSRKIGTPHTGWVTIRSTLSERVSAPSDVRWTVMVAAMTRVKQYVTGGSNIALSMAAAGFFPNLVVKMTQVGEESGALPDILLKTSDYYERRVTSTIDTLTSLLEPIMIVTIGAIVLVVVMALYLPIFTMSDLAH